MPIGPCGKCFRRHSSLCGIPAGVTLGFGARLGGARGASQTATTPKVQRYQKSKASRPVLLESLLKEAKTQKSQVDELLKGLPPDCEELLDRESKLDELIIQLLHQIAVFG